MKQKLVWVIAHEGGVYYGTWGTKKEAIQEHCDALGKVWSRCVRDGDYATRAFIQYPSRVESKTLIREYEIHD